MDNVRKVGVIALVAALMVVLGVVRPTDRTPPAEARTSITTPGGLAVLPTATPPIPGINGQNTPGIIGTGQHAIVAVFCFALGNPLLSGPCPDADGDSSVTEGTTHEWGSITLELTKLYPQDGGLPAATFAATGSNSLVVTDNSGADMDSAKGVIAVTVDAAAATLGGTKGPNQILQVRATDEWGGSVTGQLVTVDTILAFGPTGPLTTAAQEQPFLVSYHCDTSGRSPVSPRFEQPIATLPNPGPVDPDGDGIQGLDDMYDGLYSPAYKGYGPGNGYGSNQLGGAGVTDPSFTLPDVWCGGNTPGSLFDDYVDFQTDMGIFSVDPAALQLQAGSQTLSRNPPKLGLNFFLPPILDPDCSDGKSVNVYDVDAFSVWAAFLSGFPGGPAGVTGGLLKGGCDLDGWRNGVVTVFLLGNGDVGTATITAQQGGGVSPPRTVNAAFVGEPLLSLYLVAPTAIGVEGGSFKAVIVDSSFRPVGNETVSCSLDPLQSGFIIWPQTGTTKPVSDPDLPGMLMVKIVPTGKAVAAGGTLTLSCRMDRDRSVVAIGVVKLEAFESESVKLVAGCSPLAATWPDATLIDTVAKGVAPPEALDAVWVFDPESGTWKGFSAAAPEASDLASVNQLDAIFVCMNAPGTISRPKI